MTTHPPITLASRVARAESIMSANVGQEVVMLNVAMGAYYDTDRIGAVIWQQIEQPTTVAELVRWLVERYEVEHDACAQDVIAFLNDALAEGVIRTMEAGAVPPEA